MQTCSSEEAAKSEIKFGSSRQTQLLGAKSRVLRIRNWPTFLALEEADDAALAAFCVSRRCCSICATKFMDLDTLDHQSVPAEKVDSSWLPELLLLQWMR